MRGPLFPPHGTWTYQSFTNMHKLRRTVECSTCLTHLSTRNFWPRKFLSPLCKLRNTTLPIKSTGILPWLKNQRDSSIPQKLKHHRSWKLGCLGLSFFFSPLNLPIWLKRYSLQFAVGMDNTPPQMDSLEHMANMCQTNLHIPHTAVFSSFLISKLLANRHPLHEPHAYTLPFLRSCTIITIIVVLVCLLFLQLIKKKKNSSPPLEHAYQKFPHPSGI